MRKQGHLSKRRLTSDSKYILKTKLTAVAVVFFFPLLIYAAFVIGIFSIPYSIYLGELKLGDGIAALIILFAMERILWHLLFKRLPTAVLQYEDELLFEYFFVFFIRRKQSKKSKIDVFQKSMLYWDVKKYKGRKGPWCW